MSRVLRAPNKKEVVRIPRRKTTKAQRAYVSRYQKKLKRYTLGLNPEKDDDLRRIEKLDSQKSYTQYLKNLIDKDLA